MSRRKWQPHVTTGGSGSVGLGWLGVVDDGASSYLVLGAAAEPWPASCPLSFQPRTDKILHPTSPNPKSGGCCRPVQPARHTEQVRNSLSMHSKSDKFSALEKNGEMKFRLFFRLSDYNVYSITMLWLPYHYVLCCAVVTCILSPCAFWSFFLEYFNNLHSTKFVPQMFLIKVSIVAIVNVTYVVVGCWLQWP